MPSSPPLPYLLGKQSALAFSANGLSSVRAFDYLNKRVKPGEKVLLIGEHRIYGASFEALWSDWFDTPALLHIMRDQKMRNAQELMVYLKRNQVKWILVNEAELRPQMTSDFRPMFSDREWKTFEEIRNLEPPMVDRTTVPPGVTILRL